MATRPPKIPHLVGTNKILNLEDVYGNIGDICGITKIDSSNPLPDDADTISIRQATSNGILRRAVVRLASGKIRTVYMVAANCPKVGALANLEYTTGLKIKSARFQQHITLG